MEEDKFKDLLEDEELTALRLAALASTRKKEQNLNKLNSANALPIDSIVTASNAASELVPNQIPFVQSDRSSHNNYSWRKQNHSLRRRNGPFSNNQRSNLIVINPVSLNDEKDSKEKAPPLILPQHRWCNSGNEDSMSPKTLRRTGPTRFNRHGSDSESSDDESDYERSDNDSGSNETILQDEPSEHFSRLSPGCDNLSDGVERQRRLSFQSLDSDIKSDTLDKNEATSVYKSLKNSLYSDPKQDRYAVQHHLNDGEQTFSNSNDNKYSNCNAGHSYVTKSSNQSEDLAFKQSHSNVGKRESCSDTINIWQDMNINNSSASYSKDAENSQNFRLSDGNHKDYVDKRPMFTDVHGSKESVWQHRREFRADNSLYPTDIQHISTDSTIYNEGSSANSHHNLRLELKKRMKEMKSNTCIENNATIENRTYSQYDSSWERNRSKYSHKGDEVNSSQSKSLCETLESSFHQANRDKITQESFSGRNRNRYEYFDERKRYDRSSSVDRNRSARSSSRDRKRERSSSRDNKRYERSSSQGRIRRNSSEGRNERKLSPSKNKFEYSDRHNKNSDDRDVTEEKRDWYNPGPREKAERSSSRDRSKRDRSTSSERKRDRSTSQEKNKFSSSNSKSKQEYSTDNDKSRHYSQSHDKNHYENNPNRDRSRYVSNSNRDQNRHERSNQGRSRHESSRSTDSRSDRSSSREKHRYGSGREESKIDQSSSENESRYKSNFRHAYNPSKFHSNQETSRLDIMVNQKSNIKENESNKNTAQECDKFQNKKINILNSEKMNDDKLKKVGTKDQSISFERNRLESNSKEKKIEVNRPYREYSDKNSFKKRYSRSRSSSSESCSSSYSSSSSHSHRPKIRSVTSVIKPVSLVKSDTGIRGNLNENKSVGKSTISTIPQSSVHSVCTKRNMDDAEISKPSSIKSGRMDGDSKASEGKRVPVHMRLGAFPRKRVIQMPKDVEAAFVNSSSSSDDENVSTKCKKQNIRIVTDIYDAKNRIDLIQQKYSSADKPAKRSSPDTYNEKFKRVKAHR